MHIKETNPTVFRSQLKVKVPNVTPLRRLGARAQCTVFCCGYKLSGLPT
jgi:hypothetical protein